MASATPDLRLPSQPQGVTAPRPVPNLLLGIREARVCEQPAEGCYVKAERPFSRKSAALTIIPPGHTDRIEWCELGTVL